MTGGFLERVHFHPDDTLTIRKVIVDGVVFRREFSKEQFGEV